MTAAEIEARVSQLEVERIKAGEWWKENWAKYKAVLGAVNKNADDIAALNVRMARLGPYIGLAATVGALIGGGLVTIVIKVVFGS